MRFVRVCIWGTSLPIASGVEISAGRFAPVDLLDAEQLAAAMGVSTEEVTARMAWSRCYAGRVEDQLVTMGWVSLVDTWIGEIDTTIRPAAGEAYIWDCRTSPPFRGRGLYRDLLTQIMLDLGRTGVRRVWIATLDRDSPGYRGVQRAGFHRVLRIRHLRLGGLQWWSVHEDGKAATDEIGAARRAVRQGRPPERQVATRLSAVPPAPVRNR